MKVLSLLVSASLASISLPLMASDAAVDNTLEIKVQNSLNQLCSSITSTTGKEVKRDTLGNYILTAGEHAVNNYLCTVSENKASDKLYIYQIEQHKANWYASSDYQGHDNWKKNLQANQKELDISEFIDSNNWLALSNQNGIIRLGFKTNVQKQNRYAIKVHNNTAENFKNCQIKLNDKELSFAELLPKHVTNLSVEYDKNVNLIKLSCDVNSKDFDIFITGGSKYDREYKWSKYFAETHYYTLHKQSYNTPKGQLYDVNVDIYDKSILSHSLPIQQSSVPYFADMTNLIQLLPYGGTLAQMFDSGYSLFRILTGNSVSPFAGIVTRLTDNINKIFDEKDLKQQIAHVNASINGNRNQLETLDKATTKLEKVQELIDEERGYFHFLSGQFASTTSGSLENANAQIIKLWDDKDWHKGRYLKSVLQAQIALIAQKLFLYKMEILNLAYVSKYYKDNNQNTNLTKYSCRYKTAVSSLESYIDDATSGLESVISRVNSFITYRTGNAAILMRSKDGANSTVIPQVNWGESLGGYSTFYLVVDLWSLHDAMDNDTTFWWKNYGASYGYDERKQDVRNSVEKFIEENQQYWVSDLQEMKRQLESYKQLSQELIDKTRSDIAENQYCGVKTKTYTCSFYGNGEISDAIYPSVMCTPEYNGKSTFYDNSGCQYTDLSMIGKEGETLDCSYSSTGPLHKQFSGQIINNPINCTTNSGAPVCKVELYDQ